jgi:hypothetical protein
MERRGWSGARAAGVGWEGMEKYEWDEQGGGNRSMSQAAELGCCY